MKRKIIWMDGKFVRWKNAKVHVMTHAIHYGTGIFEGIRCYKAEAKQRPLILFRLHDHVKRFFLSAKALSLEFPYTPREIEKIIIALIKKNNMEEAYVRPFAFYGEGRIGPDPRGAKVHVAILTVSLKGYLGFRPIHVKTPPFRRISAKALVSGAKISGSYFNAALASMWAHANGADEALMLDSKGYVAEGAAENFFVIRGKNLITPKSHDLLPGITRDTIMKIAPDLLMLRAYERKMKLSDVYKADEAFFTGTGAEIHPIAKVNGRKIGNGKIGKETQRISTIYKALTRGKIPKYRGWLTEVS